MVRAGEDSGTENDANPSRFDTRIAVPLRGDLEAWQRLNATAFLVSGIGPVVPEMIGKPYPAADGTGYLVRFRQPALVSEGGKEALTRSCGRAVDTILKGARMHL